MANMLLCEAAPLVLSQNLLVRASLDMGTCQALVRWGVELGGTLFCLGAKLCTEDLNALATSVQKAQ
eukprot:2087148-Amphidinium_carterae.2